METPDTYFYFVLGYSAFWIILFGLIASLLIKIQKLEKRLGPEK